MGSVSLKNLRVMFVEDERDIRESMVSALEDEFEKLITAKDGDEGLKKYKKFKPDIIITDISMPIMDGLEMTAEIRKISKDVPIVVLSAFSDKEKLLRAIDVGINKYIIKPIDLDELISTLEFIAKEFYNASELIDICEGYQYDKSKRMLIKDGIGMDLTKKEMLFIVLLMKNVGAYVLYEDIKKSVWPNKSVSDPAIRTFIKRVREKTGRDFIKNIPSLGYKINVK